MSTADVLTLAGVIVAIAAILVTILLWRIGQINSTRKAIEQRNQEQKRRDQEQKRRDLEILNNLQTLITRWSNELKNLHSQEEIEEYQRHTTNGSELRNLLDNLGRERYTTIVDFADQFRAKAYNKVVCQELCKISASGRLVDRAAKRS